MAGLGRKVFTAGEVLTAANVNDYLMDQAVQVYAGTAARGSALGTAQAEGLVTYLSDTDTIQVALGTATWANVASFSTATAGFTAISNGTAGITYQPVSPNYIINGAFDIWQRGTTFTANGYGADRWYLSGSNFSLTRQSSTPPVGSRFYSRVTATAGTSFCGNYQAIETQNVAELRGKTITVSAKIRRNSTMTVGLRLIVEKNSIVDAGVTAGGWDSMSTLTVNNADITTGTGVSDWTNVITTIVVPNDGTANSIRVSIQETAAMNSGSIWELAQVQLEAGSVATPFKRAANTLQGELAACQRYYFQITNANTAGRPVSNIGYYSATAAFGVVPHPVEMRTAPTVSFTNTGAWSVYSNGVGRASTDVALNAASTLFSTLNFTTSSATAGNAGWVEALTGQNGSINFSSEL